MNTKRHFRLNLPTCFFFMMISVSQLFADDRAVLSQEKEVEQLEYLKLDSKYYPFIRARNKTYDKDIIKIINNVDRAFQKNTFFVGFSYGFNINTVIPMLGSTSSTGFTQMSAARANGLLFGLRIGYQKYTGTVLPVNTFGYQIYGDLCFSAGINGLFFNGLNLDMLWDFLDRDWVIGSLNFGIGVGVGKITGFSKPPIQDIYEVAYRLNLGISFRINHHHRMGFYSGNIQGLERGFFGHTFTVGYDYVF